MSKFSFCFYVLLSVFLICLSQAGNAQDKFEREFSIEEAEVPKNAVEFVLAIGELSGLRWFREESDSTYSFEAKANYNRAQWSIEFSSTGQIEDIEKAVLFTKIEAQTKGKIERLLNEKHNRYKVLKIQEQHVGSGESLLAIIQDEHQKKPLRPNYELEVKTKTGKIFEKWEYLFDYEGNFIARAKYIPMNTDILEY